MKMKYITVASDGGWGAVKHIILQVEDTDTFITSNGIDPGYKIIIDCTKHHFSAAGGHTFNPYHNESARKKSRTLSENESDVLGFYLSQVDDIDSLPDKIESKKFWNVVFSNSKRNHEEDCFDTFCERIDNMYNNTHELDFSKKYYKVLYTDKVQYKTLRNVLDNAKNYTSMISEFNDDLSEQILKALKETEERSQRIGTLDSELKPAIYFSIIDSETYKEVDRYWCNHSDKTIADYLWCQFDELPLEEWDKYEDKNDLYSYKPYCLKV